MGDCNVCIDMEYDGGGADFSSESVVKARKEHRCCECRSTIPKGAQHERSVGKWDGDFSQHRTCLLCVEIRAKFVCGGFFYGELWIEMRETVFPQLTTGCLDGLSADAKQRVVDKWSKWKFREGA